MDELCADDARIKAPLVEPVRVGWRGAVASAFVVASIAGLATYAAVASHPRPAGTPADMKVGSALSYRTTGDSRTVTVHLANGPTTVLWAADDGRHGTLRAGQGADVPFTFPSNLATHVVAFAGARVPERNHIVVRPPLAADEPIG